MDDQDKQDSVFSFIDEGLEGGRKAIELPILSPTPPPHAIP